MENVILVIHLILALCLIGVVLIQRSEGGGLGMGGGDAGGVSARGAATALGKMTWVFAIAFICTSVTLTVFARQEAASSSIVDGLSAEELLPNSPEVPALPNGDALLPPATTDAPLTPPRAE